MANWSTPQEVLKTIQAGDDTAYAQSANRAKINNAANGDPPLDAKAAEKLGLKINVNFGDLTVALANARRSYDEAVLGQERFFKVTIPTAPAEKEKAWGLFITNFINDLLKEDEDLSEDYASLKEFQIGALVSHGLGPLRWCHPDDLLPGFVALEDLRVPTDTLVSFKNLEWFAERHLYTPGELVAKVWGEHVLPGWNKPAITKILENYKGVNWGATNDTWQTAPEKMADLVKQSGSYFTGDAMPTISLWHFYFKDQDGKEAWYLSVIPENATAAGLPDVEFLYQSSKPVAQKLSQLLQCQFGDLNTKAPFLFHSVRSLGFLLMDPTWWTNLTRCRFMQHAHESMNPWFRVTDPAGKARAQLIDLYNMCILPEGVAVVPQNERHQVNQAMLESTLAQLRQLANEASSSYTHQLDTGTQKEQTATETMANLQRVNAMMSGLLGRFFRREKFFHREICRRFCRKDTVNRQAREFQAACQRFGIPGKFLDVALWKIEPEKPLGSGNPTMALMQADKMMSLRPLLGPDAQQQVLRDALAVYGNDPRKAAALVPPGKTALSTGAQAAQYLFGSLMVGVPGLQWEEGLSVIDGIGHLLGLLAGKCAAIHQSGGMTDQNTLSGLTNTLQFIGTLIGRLAQDPQAKPQVRQFGDSLGQLANELKGFAQRLAESQQQAQPQGGDDGTLAKTQAQIQGKMMIDAAKARQTELNQAQKRRHKEDAFMGDQKRKDVQTLAEMRRQELKAVTEAQNAPAPQPGAGE